MTAIVWLKDHHEKVTVVKRFLEENPSLIETKTTKGLRRLLRGQGRQWHPAIDEAFEDVLDV